MLPQSVKNLTPDTDLTLGVVKYTGFVLTKLSA